MYTRLGNYRAIYIHVFGICVSLTWEIGSLLGTVQLNASPMMYLDPEEDEFDYGEFHNGSQWDDPDYPYD